MARLIDVRRWFPPEDASQYAAAYEEAVLAEKLGMLVHELARIAGVAEAELAARTGVSEDELTRAEEGDASTTVAFLDRLARAAGVRLTLAGGEVVVALGAVPAAAAGSPEV